MFVIVHSGQTGVERGAHFGALAAGFRVSGYMTAAQRDEMGALPDDVAKHLLPSPVAGPRGAIRSNLEIADAVMIVVPTAHEAMKFPAMDWVLRGARSRKRPLLVCDPATSASQVAAWAAEQRAAVDSVRLLVTGPRATRWQAGEDISRRLVRSLAIL